MDLANTLNNESHLRRLSLKNHSRQSLALDNDYEESVSSGKTGGNSSEVKAVDEVPLVSLQPNNASVQQMDIDELKLVKRRTDEEIYELTTRITVDKRRFSNEGVPKSRLNDVKFIEKQSILDMASKESGEFHGFFTLFWVGVAVTILNIMVNYYLEHGLEAEIVNILLTNLVEIALTDLWMYLSMYIIYGLHYAIKQGWMSWEGPGWIISSLFEFCFFVNFTIFAERQQYQWIGKIFLFLHSLVMLMKIHSYSFYNGYLWSIKRELEFSKGFVKKIDTTPQDVHDDYTKLLNSSIQFCEFELKSQSTATPFPSNITVQNFFWYTMFPSLVYQIDFPRSARIRWEYVCEKIAAIFGVIMIMIVIAQNMMYPIAMRAISMKGLPIIERLYQYPLLLLNMMPSFVIIYILVFYLIWDAILNCIAELTRFGDRDFYGPWWNCVSWDQFARYWNIPVHKFLLRHVYHSSISAFQLSKHQATLFTFLLSSILHELAMFVLFHKFRGYLLLLQMFQLPLIAISKTRFLKDKKTLGNVIFWIGIITGPSMMCTLYLTF